MIVRIVTILHHVAIQKNFKRLARNDQDMTEKKGFLEKIFGKNDSCCCGPGCCGPKIVPKTDAKKNPDEKEESQK